MALVLRSEGVIECQDAKDMTTSGFDSCVMVHCTSQLVTWMQHQNSGLSSANITRNRMTLCLSNTVLTRSIAVQSAIRTRNCETSVQVDLLSATYPYADPIYNYATSIPTQVCCKGWWVFHCCVNCVVCSVTHFIIHLRLLAQWNVCTVSGHTKPASITKGE